MAKTITVAPGPSLAPGQVAIWEVNDEHPGGEVFLAAPHKGDEAETFEVARTPEVSKRLNDSRLVEVELKPKPRPIEAPARSQTAPARQSAAAFSASTAATNQQHPAAGTREVIPGVTEAQQRALVDAGYVTADDIRKASDADLLKVDGVGPATVAALRDATKE